MINTIALVIPKIAGNTVLKSTGNHHAWTTELEVRADLIRLGSIKSIEPIAEPNTIRNQGMTNTKIIVFRVARLLFFEVMPIHIPNQASARRLAKLPIPEATARAGTRKYGDGPNDPAA